MDATQIITILVGMLGTMGTAYAVIQEARIRALRDQIAVLINRNESSEREAKEYVAILLTIGAENGISLEQAKAIAGRVLRGQRGYG